MKTLHLLIHTYIIMLNCNYEPQIKCKIITYGCIVYYDIVCADLICHTSCCNSILSPSLDVYKNQLIRIE